jgi:ribosomal protein S18 acetylase RimI-like enzyme
VSRPVRPLEVQPDVMARIRPMQQRDAAAVARQHHAAMGASLWARLGVPFLEALYQALVDSPHFLAFVYEDERGLGGFIAGSTDTSRMYRETLRAHYPALGVAALRGLLRRPRVVAQLLRTSAYFEASGEDVPAESLFCSFRPDLRGSRISGHINKVLFDELAARGHRRVKITTEADNVGANRQLGSWGFEIDRRFEFYGKAMVRYILDLQGSPRVEPISRHPAV